MEAEAELTLRLDATMRAILVAVTRPVRVQAAKDIAATCPYYVPKSFKALG